MKQNGYKIVSELFEFASKNRQKELDLEVAKYRLGDKISIGHNTIQDKNVKNNNVVSKTYAVLYIKLRTGEKNGYRRD